LENIYWARWRKDPEEQLYFSRRNIIHNKIKELISQGKSEESTLAELET
jgi:hypothetical protein